MELTEISGNMRLYFKDFKFGLPVCSEVKHAALLDAETELDFNHACCQYVKLLNAASALQDIGNPFDLYFSVSGHMLSDSPDAEARSLYYCHVQGWNNGDHNRLSVDLLLPDHKQLIRKECLSSALATRKALFFAFGGFIFACLDFSIKDIDLSNPNVVDALELYCLAKDKQFLLNELFACDYVFLPTGKT